MCTLRRQSPAGPRARVPTKLETVVQPALAALPKFYLFRHQAIATPVFGEGHRTVAEPTFDFRGGESRAVWRALRVSCGKTAIVA